MLIVIVLNLTNRSIISFNTRVVWTSGQSGNSGSWQLCPPPTQNDKKNKNKKKQAAKLAEYHALS